MTQLYLQAPLLDDEPAWKKAPLIDLEDSFSFGRSALAIPKALGRAAVGLAAETVAAPGTVARAVPPLLAEATITARSGAEAIAPKEVSTRSRMDTLSPGRREQLLEIISGGAGPAADRTELFESDIRREAFELGETVAKPFDVASDAVQRANNTKLLRKVYDLDPSRPLKQKLTDPRWWTEDFVEGAGTAVAFLFPGLAASRAGRIAGLSKLQARNLGFKVTSAFVFASETGSVDEWRDELVAKGVPVEHATAIVARGKIAYGVVSGLVERGILPAQFSQSGTGIGGFVRRLIAGGTGELAEEEVQMLAAGLTRYTVGLDPNLSIEQAIETGIMAFAPGAGISAISGGGVAKPKSVATVIIDGKERDVTQEQADRITSAEDTPSRNDLRGVPGADKLSASQRAEIKSDIQEQIDAQARIQRETTREPTQAQEEDVQPQIEPQEKEIAGTAQVRALDRSTGEITDINVAPENTVQTLRGERRARGQLKRLQDCLSRA